MEQEQEQITDYNCITECVQEYGSQYRSKLMAILFMVTNLPIPLMQMIIDMFIQDVDIVIAALDAGKHLSMNYMNAHTFVNAIHTSQFSKYLKLINKSDDNEDSDNDCSSNDDISNQNTDEEKNEKKHSIYESKSTVEVKTSNCYNYILDRIPRWFFLRFKTIMERTSYVYNQPRRRGNKLAKYKEIIDANQNWTTMQTFEGKAKCINDTIERGATLFHINNDNIYYLYLESLSSLSSFEHIFGIYPLTSTNPVFLSLMTYTVNDIKSIQLKLTLDFEKWIENISIAVNINPKALLLRITKLLPWLQNMELRFIIMKNKEIKPRYSSKRQVHMRRNKFHTKLRYYQSCLPHCHDFSVQ